MAREKSFAEREAIRRNWQLRSILRAIQARLPEGCIATNQKPIKKEVRLIDSVSTNIYWSSWVKKEGEKKTLLALFDGEKVKLLSQKDLNKYKLRSIA